MKLRQIILVIGSLTLMSVPVHGQNDQAPKHPSQMSHQEMVEAYEAMQKQMVVDHEKCLARITNDWPDQGGGFLDDVLEDFKKGARIIYRGFPATADHQPGRMNIVVDPETKGILGLWCG